MSSVQHSIGIHLNGEVMEIFFNGLYTGIFMITIFGIYTRKHYSPASQHFIALITLSMYLMSTLHAVGHWYRLWRAFVVHDFTQATIAAQIQTVPLWWEVIEVLSFSINTLIADCLFIWRCWIIWGRSWTAIVLPTLLTIIGTVFSVLADLAQINSVKHNQSSALMSKFFIDTGTVYLSFSLATTLTVTLLITFKLLRVNLQNKKAAGGQWASDQHGLYYTIIEIVVESAMLYSIAELLLLVLLVRGQPSYLYAQNAVAQVTGIAPTLILTRICLGMARPSSTFVDTRPATAINFASNPTANKSGTVISSRSDIAKYGQMTSSEILEFEKRDSQTRV